MDTFDKEQLIKSMQNIISRVSNMNDKVKALKTLDKCAKTQEDTKYMYIYGDFEIWDVYTDMIIKWQEIFRDMSEREKEIYGSSLSDDMLDPEWCKNERKELLFKIRLVR